MKSTGFVQSRQIGNCTMNVFGVTVKGIAGSSIRALHYVVRWIYKSKLRFHEITCSRYVASLFSQSIIVHATYSVRTPYVAREKLMLGHYILLGYHISSRINFCQDIIFRPGTIWNFSERFFLFFGQNKFHVMFLYLNWWTWQGYVQWVQGKTNSVSQKVLYLL